MRLNKKRSILTENEIKKLLKDYYSRKYKIVDLCENYNIVLNKLYSILNTHSKEESAEVIKGGGIEFINEETVENKFGLSNLAELDKNFEEKISVIDRKINNIQNRHKK